MPPGMLWPAILPDARLDAAAEAAVVAAVRQFSDTGLTSGQISISIIELEPEGWRRGGYRPEWRVYPASVVKAYYLAYAAAHPQPLSEEDERAFSDMIRDSSNDATGAVLDLITQTTGGPELPPAEMAEWMGRRQAVNRWLGEIGIAGVNACQKTWNEGPYGRERAGYGTNFELRNMATAQASAQLMAGITEGLLASPEQTAWMNEILERSLTERDSQTRTYVGRALPEAGYRLFSKAGSAYQVRHDAAVIWREDGRRVALSIFTDGHIGNLRLLPFLAEHVLRGIGFVPEEGEPRWVEELAERPEDRSESAPG